MGVFASLGSFLYGCKCNDYVFEAIKCMLTDDIDDLGVIAEVIESGSFISRFGSDDTEKYELAVS